MSTLHTLSDSFNPSNYAGLTSCPQLASLVLGLYHDSQAVPTLTQPQLESISFGSQLSFVQLAGQFSTNVKSVERLFSAFDSFSILFLCDASKPSSVIPDLLPALLTSEKLPMLLLAIESHRDMIIVGDIPQQQLKEFTSPSTLALLSKFTSLTSSLSSNLRNFPIKSLLFSLTARVALSQLLPLVSGPTRHATLSPITLNHIKGKVGTRIEDVGKPYYDVKDDLWDVYPDWILPKWTGKFSEAGLVDFLEVAKQEMIRVDGSAVDAIGIRAQRDRK